VTSAGADPFAAIRDATNAHRAAHRCGAYPYSNGVLLASLAAAANARRILELGTALGYTALCFAHGAPEAVIDTIDHDADHVLAARENVAANDLAGHIVVHEGDFGSVMRRLDPGYDVAFFDGFTPAPPILTQLRTLLRARGLLISANLNHGGKDITRYLAALFDEDQWLSAFVDKDKETAISVKL